MVSDTRSARKSKDEADGRSSKKKVRKDSSMISTDVSGIRSAKETSSSIRTMPSPKSRSSSKHTTQSPQSTRKSKRLEKGIPPLTPPVKRKSERLDKNNTPSPMRRSDRGKKKISSSSSGSKQSAKELSLSESKRRKEKTLIQLTMECKKVELDLEAVGNKRKKMNARSFKALFKRQRVKDIVPDGDGEPEGRDKLSDSANSRDIGSKPMGIDEDVSDECNIRVVRKLRDENIDKTDSGALQKSISRDVGSNPMGNGDGVSDECNIKVMGKLGDEIIDKTDDNALQKSISRDIGSKPMGNGKHVTDESNIRVTEKFDNNDKTDNDALQKSISRDIGSKPMGNGEDVSDECNIGVMGKLRDENIDKTDNGALQKSICSLEVCHGEIEYDVNVDSILRDNVVNEPCSKYFQTSLSVSETVNNTERLPASCFSIENIDAPELESSTCFARSPDGSVSSDSCEKFMHTKVAGTTPPSSKFENYNILGTCALCSKNIRVSYDSPEQELCSCNREVHEDLDRISTCKGRSDHGAAVTSDSAEKCDSRHLLKERHAEFQMDSHENVCALCEKDGELLYCEGKGCKRCYHLCCLYPLLMDALPGVWHCPDCVKKKLLFGVHSVSEGVESIWDVREVEVSNAKGVQRQYLVKYHGLAHIHNHWLPETQLLLENPSLVSNFVEKDQVVRWSAEWTVPNRLLRKRSIQDKVYIASCNVISVCNYEWLVKWQGLGYDHATWELENAYFLSSPLGQNLMEDYEIRCQKAKQEVNKPHEGSIVKLSELPATRSLENYSVLKNVNKLHECLSKYQNAVVLYDQEQSMTVIFFIQSVIEVYRPFLFVTASSSLSQWEAEFARLVPSVDVVVYSGNRDTRQGIRASEFYEEGGHMMLQVFLCSAEAVFEDLDRLRSVKWEAIVIDGYKHSGLSTDLEQIRMLTTNLRILLVGGQIKDTASEYLKILSLLEPDGDFDKLANLKSETNENICKLKDRLSRFIAYGSISQVSKFLEYWVPVQISNYQLEQYCTTLLSNSIPLRSCSKNDDVGALRDILLTVRKCCDHPYLLDSSVQGRLFAEQRPAAELLEIGIKASGKLELLDMILTEIKMRGLQVLILFQLIIGSGGASTGDILDDFLRQRFGPNTYERVDAGVPRTKKQAAVSRFNKKETGQFVFLLENRACSSVIKLSSLDAIFIYNSESNPANDLRALQKISIDSKSEQIKIFRLYSPFTVEERALVLAKKNLNFDNNLQTFSRTTTDTLLSWGAIYLFKKLDEYHANNNCNSALNFSSGQSLLNEVTRELQDILSGGCENTDSNAVISKVKLGVGSYSTNVPLLGEAKVELKDGEEPHVFWRNLLDGKIPQCKQLKGPCPRNRKRVHYLDESPSKSETAQHDVVKKRRRMVNKNLDPAVVEVELGAHQVTQAAIPKGGSSTEIKACNQSQDLQRDSFHNNNPNYVSGRSSFGDEVSVGVSEDGIVSSDDQKSVHSSLQSEMTKLCQILKLSEDVTHTARKFLDYVIKNHHVNSDSPSIVQAFQISLCWIAASITKQKVDKKDSFMLAEQLLNYQCTEEQANSVYSKMRSLKRMYLQSSENNLDSGRDCLVAEEDISKEPNVNEWRSQLSSYKQNMKIEIGEKSANEEHAEGQILLQKKLELKNKVASSEIDNKIKKIQKKCDKRMKKLRKKHQWKIQEFHRVWDEKRVKLETDHKLESAFIRSIHSQGSVRVDKLKLLDTNFAKKMEEHNLLKNVQLEYLEAEQLDAMNEERQKAAQWLAEAKACSSELGGVYGPPQSLDSQSADDVAGSQARTHVISPEDVFSMSGQHLEDQSPIESFYTRKNCAATSVTSISLLSEAIDHETPADQSEGGAMSLERSSLAMVEDLNQSKNSIDIGETVSANLPAPMEQVSDEIQLVDPSEELPVEVPKTVPNEFVGHVHPSELRNGSKEESEKGSESATPDALVSQKYGTDEAASGGLQNAGQTLVHSEQTVAVPEFSDLLSEQVQQDKIHQSLVSAELQDLDAPAPENQIISQTEVATSAFDSTVTSRPSIPDAPVTDEVVTPVPTSLEAPENDDTVTPVPSNLEAPVHDDVVTPVPSNHEAPVNDNVVTPVPSYLEAPVDVYISCNQPPAIEDHDQGGSPSQPLVSGGTGVIHESISQSGEDLEMHCNHLDIGSMSRVAHGQSVELSAVCQNDVAISQGMVSTVEGPIQAVLPLGIDANHLHGPNYLNLPPTHQPTSWNSTSSLLADPLQNELERMRKETEHLEKNHENMVSQLKSDCEKEIEEIITQIRKRYEVKLQETETEFRLKRNEVHKNRNTVLVNKILAEAFRSKYMDPRSSGLPGMQQEVPSSFMQQLHQLSAAPSMRPSPGASQSAPSLQISTPDVQTMQQLSVAPSTRPSPRASATQSAHSQQISTPPVQIMQQLLAAVPAIRPSAMRPSPGTSASQSAPSQQISTPAVKTMQQLSRPHSVRASVVPGQNVTAPPVQALQHASALLSGTSSRPPPVISSITPRSLRVGGEIRSAAPHLQPFRPAVAPSIPPATSAPVSQLRPLQMQPSHPVQTPPPPPPGPQPLTRPLPPALRPPSTKLVSQNSAEPQVAVQSPPNPSISTLGLAKDMDHQPLVPDDHAASTLPEIRSTFDSLELSDLEIISSDVQGNHSSAVATNVVCLSDDE